VTSLAIPGPGSEIAADCYEPAEARHTLVLAHGAGAGQHHPWMRARAADLAARGVRVITFDFPYISAGKRIPDRAPVLLETWQAVVEAVAARHADVPLCIGGKSMGGRMATMLLAGAHVPAAVHGCVALGYPLHPPGKPAQLRVAHLSAIRAPLLVVQGERDPFGSADDVRREFGVAGARADIVPVAFGGHGFEVRVRDARQADVYARVADVVTQWLDTLRPSVFV
jgi:uncharacterized protein